MGFDGYISGRKYNDNQATLRYVLEHANGVCRALGITPALDFEGKGRSMQYNEWEHKKNGTSWKQHIREEIDKLIPTVTSLDELLTALEELGYQIKRGKYISVKAPGQSEQKRSVRNTPKKASPPAYSIVRWEKVLRQRTTEMRN